MAGVNRMAHQPVGSNLCPCFNSTSWLHSAPSTLREQIATKRPSAQATRVARCAAMKIGRYAARLTEKTRAPAVEISARSAEAFVARRAPQNGHISGVSGAPGENAWKRRWTQLGTSPSNGKVIRIVARARLHLDSKRVTAGVAPRAHEFLPECRSSDARDILIPFSNIHVPVTMQSNISASLFRTGGVLFRLAGTARHLGA